MNNHNIHPYKKGEIGTFYRFGEPEIGKVHHAFRTRKDMNGFLSIMPEKNLSPTYEITGKVIDDDGTPDGLQVMVERYKRLKAKE